ncbi:MAG TPA: hypothetical protein VMR21_17375 [Vicinamibacteria bacterium]|nr:hypothetical protein [Vicinamibacteria bacterium]
MRGTIGERMPRTRSALAAAVTLALVAAASCSSPAAPDVLVDEVQIERVDVRILESFPPQAVAHVEGFLGDGCTEFHSLDQQRAGNVVTITILRQRPVAAICTQIGKLYSADIRLTGQYPPGRYVLRVNDVETTFVTQ